MKILDMNVEEMISYVIIACTVLYDVCLDGIDENDIEDFINKGNWGDRRDLCWKYHT